MRINLRLGSREDIYDFSKEKMQGCEKSIAEIFAESGLFCISNRPVS